MIIVKPTANSPKALSCATIFLSAPDVVGLGLGDDDDDDDEVVAVDAATGDAGDVVNVDVVSKVTVPRKPVETEKGAPEATAPLPLRTVASFGVGVFVTPAAEERKDWKAPDDGGLITPTMPARQCEIG